MRIFSCRDWSACRTGSDRLEIPGPACGGRAWPLVGALVAAAVSSSESHGPGCLWLSLLLPSAVLYSGCNSCIAMTLICFTRDLWRDLASSSFSRSDVNLVVVFVRWFSPLFLQTYFKSSPLSLLALDLLFEKQDFSIDLTDTVGDFVQLGGHRLRTRTIPRAEGRPGSVFSRRGIWICSYMEPSRALVLLWNLLSWRRASSPCRWSDWPWARCDRPLPLLSRLSSPRRHVLSRCLYP